MRGRSATAAVGRTRQKEGWRVSPRRPRVPDSHLGINADAQVVLHRACRGRPAAAEAKGMCDARVFEIDRPTVQ
eukprot:scaffold8634_cov115-Isochrysis_galbana.AAC.6